MKRMLAVLGAVFFLSSCATQIPVQVKKPAEINMSGARKIALLDFDYPRREKTSNILGLLYLSLTGEKNEQRNTIEEKLAKYMTDQLTLALLNTNYFTIISSKDIVAAMAKSGEASPGAVEIGKRSEAQAIVVGEITAVSRTERTVYEQEKLKDAQTGATVIKNVAYDECQDMVSLTYRVVSTANGQIIATKSFEQTRTQKIKIGKESLISQEEVCRELMNAWIPQITKQIAPYEVTEYRTMVADKAKDPDMKQADQLVKDKAYEKALSLYLAIWARTQNPAAGVNAAIMYDVTGRLADALTLIDKVAGSTGDKSAIKEQTRLRQLKAENERLESQMK
jgi:hypothetical protein